jgi:hypothetical protein
MPEMAYGVSKSTHSPVVTGLSGKYCGGSTHSVFEMMQWLASLPCAGYSQYLMIWAMAVATQPVGALSGV